MKMEMPVAGSMNGDVAVVLAADGKNRKTPILSNAFVSVVLLKNHSVRCGCHRYGFSNEKDALLPSATNY